MKKKFPTELAYVFGIVFVALGAALMDKADFGMSMVVAPAYLIYRVLSPTHAFVTFGMAEYCFQALLLIVMCLVLRRFRAAWLFSFVTAVVYGMVLDAMMYLTAGIPVDSYGFRALWYILGLLACAAGVSMMFHTYIAPEVYELFVKEVSAVCSVNINKFKTGYDCISCLVGVAMSFAFYGMWHFEGVKAGTVLCAVINGYTISRFSKLYERMFDFKDFLPLRKYFVS